jgi:hypothetical protein
MTDPLRPPRGFIVSANQAFTPEGNHRYERATIMLLRNLERSSVGAAVIGFAARFFPRHIHIQPDRAGCGEWTRNAHSRPLSVGGIDLGACVLFTPRCWQFGGIFDARSVLLHEIVHAIRHLTQSWTAAVGPQGYPNVEEFHGVTIANVLNSELGLPLRLGYTFGDPAYGELIRMASRPAVAAGTQGELQMRGAPLPATHAADRVITPTRAQLTAFSHSFARYHAAVGRLFAETRMLADALAGVDAKDTPFNPYRDAR